MDPFRDELAAAHAKIAELENEIRRLKGDHYPEPTNDTVRNELRGRQLFFLLTAVSLMLALCIGALLVFAARAGTPAGSPVVSPAYSGVAIAPTTQAPQAVPFASTSPKLDKHDPFASDKKCDCKAGDPLCSCP